MALPTWSRTIEFLRGKGHVYKGRCRRRRASRRRLRRPRADPVPRHRWRRHVDRPLMKSDGGYTYFAVRYRLSQDKFDRGFLDMIDVWGADHGGYVKRVQAAIAR
jgi:arginyl-tRNA synthetase